MAKQNKPAIRFKGFTDAWEQRKLGEIVEIKDSARIPNNEWSDIGVPYIRASDISSKNLKGTLFISSERYEFYKNKTGAPMRGDVLFNGGGEIGKSIICNDSKPIYVQGGAVLYARTSASNKLEASYLKTYYETSHSRKYIDAASAGGTMKHFTLKPAQEMPVYLPEAEEQKQIGDFYICIDNLITLHQRKYDKLQVLKKAMLEKMFPKNGSSVPEIRFEGFTDAWEQRKAKDLCSISTGKSNTQDRVDDGIYPFYVRSPIVEHSNRYLFDEEAVLTVGDGVGTGKVFHYVNGKYDLHQRVYRMFDFSEEITAKYFYYYFSNHFYDRVMSMTAKTSVDSVRYEMIADMDIALPKVKEQMAISAYFDRLDHLITLHQRELEKLQNIKKSMLEKMFV